MCPYLYHAVMPSRSGALVVLVMLLAACSAPAEVTSQPSAASGLGDRASPSVTRTVESIQFSMPSKNIGCYVDKGSARCDIVAKTWEAPAKPADCRLGWGSGLSVASADASIVCAGDTVLGAEEILGYGQAVRAGDMICESESAGVRCFNDSSGHGFTLSRQSYNIF
jgi:hypothetical protein